MANQETGRVRENHKEQKNNPKQQNPLQNLIGKTFSGKKPSEQDAEEQRMSKLKRQELLQILVSQSKEIDRLKKELHETRKKLKAKEIKIAKSGSLAEASLQIFDVLNQAQKAADLYLENLRFRAEGKSFEESEPLSVPEEPETEMEETDFTVPEEDRTEEAEVLTEDPEDSEDPTDEEDASGEDEAHGTE